MDVSYRIPLVVVVWGGCILSTATIYAQNFTKCTQSNPTPQELCVPEVDGDRLFEFSQLPGDQTVVPVIPLKSCRTKTGVIRGGMSVVVDSSQSTKTTDPQNLRVQVVTSFLDSIHSKAQQGSEPTDPAKVGVVVYGGRTVSLLADQWEADGLNQKYILNPCVDRDSANPTWPEEGAKAEWTKTIGGLLLSVCEFLRPVDALVKTANAPTDPSIDRQKDFVGFATQSPRGATDIRQFFEAISHQNMLGGSTSKAKNAIVVTDGLPNIPTRVDEATCKQKFWLQDQPLSVATDGPKAGTSFCYDRSFRLARENADRILESDNSFKEINIYHALFTDNQNSFADTDDKGTLRPDDFLIESSARSGNGKVKFKYARNKGDLESFFAQMFEVNDAAALQRVVVQVNQNTPYNAVSSSLFGEAFSIKLINLQPGANAVKVSFIFSDKSVNQSWQVQVGSAVSSGYQCSSTSSTGVTVDGDPVDSKNPKGDGVLPFSKGGTQQRVYRNSTPEARYNDSDFEPAVDPARIPKETNPASRLRLQGGTGNCGVVGGPSGGGAWWFWIPSLLFFIGKRRRGAGSLFVFLLFLGLNLDFKAYAGGLNSENFYPAVDNLSGVMFETPHARQKPSFMYGYTFSYALRPVEFGDGDSERKRVSDHIQANHFALGFNPFSNLDLGANLPIVFYAAPKDNNGYLEDVGTSRKFFFLGDLRIRAKYLLFDKDYRDGFFAAALASFHIPTGTRSVMMSDGALRSLFEIPLSYVWGGKRVEVYFTPGVSFWSNAERVTTKDQNTGKSVSLLEKSKSLLLALGYRFWLIENDTKAGSTQLEAGIRGDFNEFKPRLSDSGSPVEWAAGGLIFLSDSLSLHGSYGAGLGRGVGGPLSRMAAGLRYVDPIKVERTYSVTSSSESEEPDTPQNLENAPVASAYSDLELDKILREAKSERVPSSAKDEDSLLRLKTETEIIDIGAIRFEFNSAKLTPQAKETVKLLYDRLSALQPTQVGIDGHTDSVGSFKHNLALSQKRAQSVKAELERLGLNGKIIQTEGYSYKYPVTSNATIKGRALNRRIDVSVNGQGFQYPTTPEELARAKSWIYPHGKQPTKNQDK